MAERTPCIALLMIASAMLLACVLVMVLRSEPRDELAGTSPVSYRINPNEADVDTLSVLPEIGPGLSRRIVQDREANGPFKDAMDLARVPMIGEKTVRALEPWVVFDPQR